MTPERIRKYSLHGLEATAVVLPQLLNGLTEEVADRRPDPERFTIREALAHCADWEPIWLERLKLIAESDEAFLPGYDEEQFAIDHDYAHSNIAEQLQKFIEGRAATVAYVRAQPPEVWAKVGRHGEIGPLTFGELVMLVLAHDGYHLKQFVEFQQ